MDGIYYKRDKSGYILDVFIRYNDLIDYRDIEDICKYTVVDEGNYQINLSYPILLLEDES